MSDITFVHRDFTSIYEHHILDYIDKLPEKDIFYDLGACLGYFSLYAAKKLLDVVAIEVDPRNFEGLCRNIAANDFSIRTLNYGITDGNIKKAFLSSPYKSSGVIGSHEKTLDVKEFTNVIKDRSHYKRIEVDVDSLDNLVLRLGLPAPHHAKVDIDGSELAFLRGSPETLKNLKSMVIIALNTGMRRSELFKLKWTDIDFTNGFI